MGKELPCRAAGRKSFSLFCQIPGRSFSFAPASSARLPAFRQAKPRFLCGQELFNRKGREEIRKGREGNLNLES
jgi:hypothetical protein